MKTHLMIMLAVCCMLVSPVFAEENPTTGANPNAMTSAPATSPASGQSGAIDMTKVMNILVVFLVLSVVFEVALTPIFNWRVFFDVFP